MSVPITNSTVTIPDERHVFLINGKPATKTALERITNAKPAPTSVPGCMQVKPFSLL